MGKSKGKWTKHKLLSREPELLPYLPETKLLSEATFAQFLEQYGEAIIKPSRGSLGKKIFKVTHKDKGSYEVHGGNEKEVIEGLENTYERVVEQVRKKKIIIQRVIPLATKEQQPFDIRVMVQKKRKSSEWVVTGMAAKVASNGYFITNAVREVLIVEEVIKKSNINSKFVKKNILNNLERISILIARTLEPYYPTSLEMGMDMGVDVEGNIWIIEANLKPTLTMFSLLHDSSVLENILHFRDKNV